MNRLLLASSIIILALSSCGSTNEKRKEEPMKYDQLLFVGTYTAGDSKGISIYKYNTETGDSEFVNETPVANPSYLDISSDGKCVYAVSESGADSSRLYAYKFDKDSIVLHEINSLPTTADPCFVVVDAPGSVVATAEYTGGAISFFHISEEDDASLILEHRDVFEGSSIDKDRQKSSHVHQTILSPNGAYLFANDLGADKIYKYNRVSHKNMRKDKYVKSGEFALKAGSGPRHTVFHPNRKYAYTLTELSGEVIVFDYDQEEGDLKQKQVVVADTLHAQGGADIHITPDGRFLYASNRLEGDGLAAFAINQEDGTLTKIGYYPTGIHPRNFIITPNGKLLLVACRDSDVIQTYAIGEDGSLTALEKDIKMSMPVCVKFLSID